MSAAARGRRESQPDYELVEDPQALATVIEALSEVDRFALDTEFHRERTYFPKLALVQVAWEGRVALLDPLAVDLRPLGAVLEGSGRAIIHAAAQDLEVLDVACGTTPRRLFDTQLAGGFLGYGLASLAELQERELGVPVRKGDRLTDWLRRPLSREQLDYAAGDVANLVELGDRLERQLVERDRLGWVLEECDQLRVRVRASRDPEQAWSRIREVRQLRGRALAVGKQLAAWRERRAAQVDVPPRQVLSDLAMASIGQRAPTTDAELRKARGVEDRFLRGDAGKEILAAVAKGLDQPVPAPEPARQEVPRELRASVGLLSAWVGQLAREIEIEASLLATRADIEDLLRGAEDGRLQQGWRQELVGARIAELLGGRAALAFDRHRGLVLERRSHEELAPEDLDAGA